MTMAESKVAIHFGAGNIGRGFIGPLLTSSGYHVIFVDVVEPVISALNSQDSYHLALLANTPSVDIVSNFSALHSASPLVPEEISRASIITTSVGPEVLPRVAPTIAKGLKMRFEKGEENEATIIACENMIMGTTTLKGLIFKYFQEQEKDADQVKKYIEEKIGFANCEVDRIVPPASRRGSDEHVDDKLLVEVEKFHEWIVERKNVKGNVQVKGMVLKDKIEPFLERKLFTLNCGHAILAYIGYLKGYHDTHTAIHDPDICQIVQSALSESGEGLKKKHGFDPSQQADYISMTLRRFMNPNIEDELIRVGRKPLRKLSPEERLVGAANMASEQGIEIEYLLRGIAAAYLFDVKEDEDAVKIGQMIQEMGIEKTVQETTGWKVGSKQNKDVVTYYYEWKEEAEKDKEEREKRDKTFELLNPPKF